VTNEDMGNPEPNENMEPPESNQEMETPEDSTPASAAAAPDITNSKSKTLPKGILLPFILLASCFMWWGIANNLTDPLVKVFLEIFRELNTFEASLIQFAFYGGYFCMAIPGAIIARRYSYKTGVLVGLGVYALGCFMLIPSASMQVFAFFAISYWVLACGLGVLETNANPYVLAIGPAETATRRLNFAQSFNPVGSVIGIMLCQILVMARLPKDDGGNLHIESHQITESLDIVIFPYLAVAVLLVIVWILIAITRMPLKAEEDKRLHFKESFGRLLKNTNYVFSVIAQFFYVGAQITVWTYTNFYIPYQVGVTQEVALQYHTGALVLFGASRWVFTGLMKKFSAASLLLAASLGGIAATICVVCVGGWVGVIALIAVSGFMSLMFPTIFGLGSRELGEDTKMGASGLIMAILGGALITPFQGWVIDVTNPNVVKDSAKDPTISYLVPMFCFIVIAAYALYTRKARVSHPAPKVPLKV